MSKTARIRELLKDKPLVVAMGAYDAVSAKLVSQIGFDVVYAGGHAVAGSRTFHFLSVPMFHCGPCQ